MKLPDNEIRDITEALKQGKPLNDKYRFLLFGEQKKVELVWSGKNGEVCSDVLPFQTIEQIDEPRSEEEIRKREMALALHKEGAKIWDWTNKLIWGDNKLVLSSLVNGPAYDEIKKEGGIKLIYIDPPFDVGADFSTEIKIGKESFHKKPSVFEQFAFRDTWGRGTNSYLAMMYERLRLMHDLLAEDGSIYVHCDYRVVSWLRLVLDDVFGVDRFANEIVWQGAIGDSSEKGKKFVKSHDTLLMYRKSDKHTWNDVFQEYSETSEKLYKYKDKGGRYRHTSASNPGGGGYFYDLGLGENAPAAGYRMPETTARKWLEEGLLIVSSGTVPSIKRYMGEGVRCRDVWADINSLQGPESIGYPTQKPAKLLERIIKASSNKGDIVADFFCGSGTTAAVAEKMGRKWICSDLSRFAVHTARKRLIGVQREQKKEKKGWRAFEILNLGHYERQLYVGITPGLNPEQQKREIAKKEREYIALILGAYRAEVASGYKTLHGLKEGRMVVVGPINVPVSGLLVDEVIKECRAKEISRVDILGFDFEMGLSPEAEADARKHGIALKLKTIPPEVFDERAIEENAVVFFDLAHLEAKIIQNKPGIIEVELVDFSVFYTSPPVPNTRRSKSFVKLESGQLVQVKQGADDRRLTESWEDWIDYWAVDFNYTSKEELVVVQDPNTGETRQEKTGRYIFENKWQSFRSKKDRELELKSATHELPAGERKIGIKVVDIFGHDTTNILTVLVKRK